MKELYKKAKINNNLYGQFLFLSFIKGKSKLWEGQYASASMITELYVRVVEVIQNHFTNPKIDGLPYFCKLRNFTTIQGNKNRDKLSYDAKNRTIRFFDYIINIPVQDKSHPDYKRFLYFDKIANTRMSGINEKTGLPRRDDSSANSPISNVRIIKRMFNGVPRLFAQIVVKDEPYSTSAKIEGKVGLDLGVSTVAVVAENVNGKFAELLKFMPNMESIDKERRILERKLDRSTRATSPQCFREEDGRWLKNKKKNKDSNNYKNIRAHLNDIERRRAVYRKNEHGRLTNYIITNLGSTIITENVSVQGWASGKFGKSITEYSPGTFMSKLEDKSDKFIKLNTQKTCLSQHCVCGNKKKKELSERIHHCEVCGRTIQRDLLSAYLMLYTNEENITDFNAAQYNWTEWEPILTSAWNKSGISLQQETSLLTSETTSI